MACACSKKRRASNRTQSSATRTSSTTQVEFVIVNSTGEQVSKADSISAASKALAAARVHDPKAEIVRSEKIIK